MNSLLVLLSELPVLLLLAGKGRIDLVISLAVWLALCGFVWITGRKKGLKVSLSIRYPILTILLCLAAGILFYLRWSPSGRLAPAAALIRRPLKQTCLILAACLSSLAAPGIDYAVRCVLSLFNAPGERGSAFSPLALRIYIFLTSLVTITLNSKCSPLYPFNDWVDPNTMFTVGKGVLKGAVPYRDLYEQKGPVILFVHTLGAAISFDSFFGIWILEVLFCFFFLYLAYKTMALFAGEKVFVLIPAAALLICSGKAFQSGDSAEEFALPFIMYSLYTGCKALKEDRLPSGKEFFLIGITSGFIFWMKYSMVGSYIGWFLLFLAFALKRKQIPQLVRGIGLILLGIAVLSLPVFIYFAVHSSVGIFLRVYFYNNLFLYPLAKGSGKLLPFLGNVISGFADFFKNSPFAAAVCLAGLIRMLFRKERSAFIFVLACFAGAFLLVYIGGRFFPYYCLLLSPFAVFGLLWAADLPSIVSRLREQAAPAFSVLTLGVCTVILCCISRNMSYLEYEKEDLLQYKMKEYIESTGIEDPTLLNYHRLDLGVNTAAGLVPRMRFFCSFNITELKEMEEEQETCLKEGCVDFVIAHSPSDSTYPEFEAYDHIGWFAGTVSGGLAHFHYYMRK